MNDEFEARTPRKKVEKKRIVVEINLSPVWSYKDRLQFLIEGAQLSVDEIIKSLHQPMELETLRDISFKNATSGREEAIETAKNILQVVEGLSSSLEDADEKGANLKKDKDFSSGLAEKFAKEKE